MYELLMGVGVGETVTMIVDTLFSSVCVVVVLAMAEVARVWWRRSSWRRLVGRADFMLEALSYEYVLKFLSISFKYFNI